MNAVVSTLPLEWRALCQHVRRPLYESHRGELPLRGKLPADAPVNVAACAQFGVRHRFTTEREFETFRWVGARAQDAVVAWSAAIYSREDCRVSAESIRYWRQNFYRDRASAIANIKRDLAEFRERWRAYRRHMRMVGRQVGWVREQLTPRPLVRMAALQAAE